MGTLTGCLTVRLDSNMVGYNKVKLVHMAWEARSFCEGTINDVNKFRNNIQSGDIF